MITKEMLIAKILEVQAESLRYIQEGLFADDVEADDFAYKLGSYEGCLNMLKDLLALLDNANEINS